jgi:hypothetical protein
LRRSVRLNRVVAAVTWTAGSSVLLFEIWAAMQGKLNPYNLLNTIFVVVGCALGGILALSGDGDVVFFTGLDEGQRDAVYKAATPAFSLAFWGLFALWMAWQLQPAWRADADVQVGVLLVVISIAYLLLYLWQRRHS